MFRLAFVERYSYVESDSGIIVPVWLSSETHKKVRVEATVDTGASYCFFQRDYGEGLGLDIPAGHKMQVATATGTFDAYGHTVRMESMQWGFEAMVYFAERYEFRRNVLGRKGWLNRFRLGIIEADAVLYCSHYND